MRVKTYQPYLAIPPLGLLLGCAAVALLLGGCMVDETPGAFSDPRSVNLKRVVSTPPLPRISGRLVDFARTFRGIQKQCKPLLSPDDVQLADVHRGVAAVLDGRLADARHIWEDLGFTLFELVDEGRQYYVAAEAYGVPVRGWGFFVFNPRPRRSLILEAPHPRHDLYTGEQAAELFSVLDARALLISTTYRCSSTAPSGCEGRTGACRQIWRRGRYRRSDMAHVPRSVFHATHRALMDQLPDAVAIQLHGFFRRPGRRLHVIASDGTRLPGSKAGVANRFARALRKRLPRKVRYSVRSCNERNNRGFLCATHNVQGRYTNGSPNPCRKKARRSTNRFLHLEQSIEARRFTGPITPELIRDTLLELWPPTGALYATRRPSQAPIYPAAEPSPWPATPWTGRMFGVDQTARLEAVRLEATAPRRRR